MPNINDMVKERANKKFVKKTYRPWDLSGESSSVSAKETTATPSFNTIIVDDTNSSKTVKSTLISEGKSTSEIDIKLDNIKETNEQQIGNIQITNGHQFDNTKVTFQITNREHLDITLDPTSINHQVMKLSGIQKIILDFIVDFCIFRNHLETGPIETSVLASYAKATNGVVKISIKRLIDKGFIIRNKGKQAKGGYINLSITQNIYDAVIEHRKRTNTICNPADFINTIRYQIDNNESYNSSSIYNKTTTNKKREDLSEEWAEIKYENLQEIGFGKTQIRQLVDICEPSIVQESINHFAFCMEYNPKFKKYEDPLNVLMGVLRKGGGWFEKDYRSPKEIAQQKLLEIKKAEIERRKEIEEDAYKLALAEWQQTLSHDEIENIAPSSNRDITPRPAKLSIYFKENIWPDKKSEYLI